MDNKVHISYKWTDPSKGIVRNWLYPVLQDHGYDARIDVENCKYMANIPLFEREIGEAELIILVIQSQYLESEDCLFEATYVISNKNIENRLLIINLDNSRIDGDVYVKMVGDYNAKWQQCEDKKKQLAKTDSFFDNQIMKYSTISKYLGTFAKMLRDSNTLDFTVVSKDDFKEVFEYLEQLKQRRELIDDCDR